MQKIRFLALLYFLAIVAYGSSSPKDILTTEERLWLTQNESHIVYALETNYAPFVFIGSNGEPTGLAYEYMKLAESKLGVHFKEKRFSSLDDIFSEVRSQKVHIVNAVTATPKRSEFLAFTNSFISIPNVIIVNKSREEIIEEKDLLRLKVSLVKSYAVTEYLMEKGLVTTPDLVSNDLSALLNVSFGSSDAAVVDLATASYLISNKGITNLRVAGETDFNIQLAMATSSDKPVLRTILQKGVAAITDKEKEEIHERWINAYSSSIFNDWRFWTIVGILLFVFLLIVVWNRTLQYQIGLRTKAEKKLQLLNTELRKEVEEAVAKRMRIEVEHFKELDRVKTLFIASMSHELRTPLNAIIGFSSILKAGMVGPINQKQKEQLKRIHDAGEHLLSMIVEVIDISKIESKQIPFTPENFSLNQLIEELGEELEKKANKKGLNFQFKYSENIVIYTDRLRIKQVIENYLTNAIKYSEKGTIVICVKMDEGFVTIEVADNGIGIADKDIEKLFQPFERLDSPMKVLAGGTGLGLYLNKKIVEELMHGEVYVHSHLGEGSTFGVRIPFVKDKSPKEQNEN